MSTDPEPTGGQTQPDKPSQRPPGAGKPTPESIPAGERAPGAPVPPLMHKTPWTAYIKPAAWTLAAIYVIVFVFLNRDVVSINFLAFTTSVPLIFVLVGMALIGAGLCAGIMLMASRRSTEKAELAAYKSSGSAGEK
jgi:uncharacterized integral membrane protein